MNNETHEDRVVVLSEAPEGEFDIVVIHTTNLIEYAQSPDKSTIRSLADIQKLVDMQNEIDELKESAADDFVKAMFGEFCNSDNGVDFTICDHGVESIKSFLSYYKYSNK